MVKPEKWLTAQLAERKQHTYSYEEGFPHYRDSYKQYFDFTGASFSPRHKIIVEIGPADFPALSYCSGYWKGIVVEPMPSAMLKTWAHDKTDIEIYAFPMEYFPAEILAKDHRIIEVWLFNVLQHVIDPEIVIAHCKKIANVIRFFEPINCGTDECHLWNLTMEMFNRWFGQVQHYPTSPNAINFHTHECAYGSWYKINNR